ncbi:thiamine-binding protein [Parasphingorhabdus pacifica]
MKLNAEFTTEPFEGEGDPPAHAVAAVERLRAAGLEPDFGPLGTALTGNRETVLSTLPAVMDSAFEAGARRITLQVTVDDDADGES